MRRKNLERQGALLLPPVRSSLLVVCTPGAAAGLVLPYPHLAAGSLIALASRGPSLQPSRLLQRRHVKTAAACLPPFKLQVGGSHRTVFFCAGTRRREPS